MLTKEQIKELKQEKAEFKDVKDMYILNVMDRIDQLIQLNKRILSNKITLESYERQKAKIKERINRFENGVLT